MLTYQIRSLDQNYDTLYTSYPIPLSVNNTGCAQEHGESRSVSG